MREKYLFELNFHRSYKPNLSLSSTIELIWEKLARERERKKFQMFFNFIYIIYELRARRRRRSAKYAKYIFILRFLIRFSLSPHQNQTIPTKAPWATEESSQRYLSSVHDINFSFSLSCCCCCCFSKLIFLEHTAHTRILSRLTQWSTAGLPPEREIHLIHSHSLVCRVSSSSLWPRLRMIN